MFAIAMLISAVVTLVRAEMHQISFFNGCGTGTPQLVIGGKVVSEGPFWFGSGPQSGIAYLQNGNECGLNGENCAIVQFTLSDAAGSDAAISLIPPHAFNFPIEYYFSNGCTGVGGGGVYCDSADCDAVLHTPNDQAGTVCQGSDASLVITFCHPS